MKLTITLTGNRPMLQHNGMLADPLYYWTRELAARTGKRNKTDQDHIEIMEIEARGSAYWTESGTFGMPTDNVFASFKEGAKEFRLGNKMTAALRFEPAMPPVLIDGAEVKIEEYLSDVENIDRRPVRVKQNKVIRSRPILPAGWQTVHEFELDPSVISMAKFEQIIEVAGWKAGLGDYHPRYGTYTASID